MGHVDDEMKLDRTFKANPTSPLIPDESGQAGPGGTDVQLQQRRLINQATTVKLLVSDAHISGQGCPSHVYINNVMKGGNEGGNFSETES